MPATAAKPSAAAKHESEVQQQLGRIVRRIRTHDVLCGVFLLGVATLGYVAAVIALDRWLELPAWVRQVGFLGLVASLGAVLFFRVVRPLRLTVNPLYAAREVEVTVEDAKNSVVNWVDLQDKPLSEGARALVAARAAKQFRDADLDKAGESKRLLWLGGSFAGVLVLLAVLFMVFKPAVFNSLVGRAINPFSAGGIATRTQITLVEPKDGDLTVTAGQPVTVGVQIGGKVPEPDSPQRLVVLLRHNQADENFDEVPLESGASYREWAVRLPERLVQNGFWYRVRGGDAETLEHRVTVRPKPTFTEYELSYQYPDYLRMKPDTTRNPHVEAYRGTVVTVTAKANRTLKDGRAEVRNQPTAQPGEIVGDARDSLRVRLMLAETTTYRLQFTSTDGEANADAPVFDLRVLTDQPPTAAITSPKDEDVTLPVNGTLAVDGQLGDDFGLDRVSLKLRLVEAGLPPRPLKAKLYQGGRSFKRDADNTYPTAIDYKDSVPLAKLTDETGAAVTLKPDATLEYWLEAIDNCTVPTANVGRSKVQRVKLVAAKVEPKQQEALKRQAEQRQSDDANHQQQQERKLNKEDRPAKPSPQQNADPTAKPNEAPEQPAPGGQGGEPKPRAAGQPGGEADPPMPATTPSEQPANKQPAGAEQPKPAGEAQSQPAGEGQPKPADEAAANKELQKRAEEIHKQRAREEKQAGQAKGGNQPQPEQAAPSGEKKAKPAAGEQAESKGPPDAGEQQEKPAPLGGAGGSEKQTPEQKPSDAKPAGEAGAPKNEQATPEEAKGGDARGQKPATPGEAKKGPKPEDAARPKGEEKPAEGAKDAAASKEAGRVEQQQAGAKSGDGADKQNPWQRGTEKPLPADRRQKLEEAMDQLANGDEKAKQPAREKLDEMVGEQARKEAEQRMDRQRQAAEKMKSDDPKQRAEGQQEATDLQREAVERAAGQKSRERQRQAGDADTLDREKLKQDVKDLNSDDAQKQQAARKSLDEKIGADARKDIEQLGKNLKNGDSDRQQAGKDELQKVQKQMKQDAAKQDAQAQGERQQQVEKNAKDLAGDDAGKKDAARDQLDKTAGQPAREKAEQQMNARKEASDNLKSKDAGQQQRGKEQQAELQKKELDRGRGEGKPGDKQPGPKEVADSLNDLDSTDPQKRKAAEEKLDKQFGEAARKKAKQLADDLKSDDKQRQQGAAEEIQKLQEAAERQAKQNAPKADDKPSAAKQQELENAAKNVAGDDPQKKQAAQEKLDRELGKERRTELEKSLKARKDAANDLNAKDDPARQARGEEKKQQLQRDAAEQEAKDRKPNDAAAPDRKEVEEALKDLNSNDEARKQAARDKLDKQFGEQARKKAEGMMDDLKSGDKARQQGAIDELKKMEEQAEKHAQQADDKRQSAEEMERLAKAAEDLKSQNETKRKQAEQQLDEKIGEAARKQLQEQMKADTPPGREQLDALKKAAEQAAKRGDGKKELPKGGPGLTPADEGKPLEANKDFGKQAGELRLRELKDIQDKKQQQKYGYTEEEFKRFLDGYQKMVRETPEDKPYLDRVQDRLKEKEAAPTNRVNDASKLGQRANDSQTTTGTAAVSAAPPGYGDARKKFAEGANKPAPPK